MTLDIRTQVKVVENIDANNLPESILSSNEPLILKGLVKHWPIVSAAQQSDENVDEYLRQFYPGVPVQAYRGDAAINQRFFYNHDFSAKNFEQQQTRLDTVLDNIKLHRNTPTHPSFYMGSTTLDYCLPDFRQHNDINLAHKNPLVSIWVGNQTRIAAHFDIPDNIACVAAGKRQFILFPPEQLKNMYVGPLDFTPAGQSVSLVDFANPDYQQFPKFKQALQQAQIADMEAGDAIFIPSMWWHHVQSFGELNVLINYWWRDTPAYMGSPMDVLEHALLSLRNLPQAQRQAWQQHFEHYIFNAEPETHIPQTALGSLAPIDELMARRIRSQLLSKLNK